MVNRIFSQVILPVTLAVGSMVGLGIFLQIQVGNDYFLADINGIGWLLGVVGTIYTLVAAFTMVEVWNQFNNMSNLISEEARALSTLWDYAEYLNDPKFDKMLQKRLLAYISAVLASEHPQAATGIRPTQNSKELTDLMRTLDQVQFNDKRDSSVFPHLIGAFEKLSITRSARIEASVTRLPQMIKIFFLVLSLLLMTSYLLVGYNHLTLYLIHTTFGALIIALSYRIILDLDNPFDGYWNVDTSAFDQAKKYISSSRHEK